ncbi:MAG: hypothetical protein ABIH63_01520 [archaeon]
MKLFLFFILLSSEVFAIAVAPSYLDFSDSREAKLVVFNTEDYVRDFYLSVGSGFRVSENSLRIPPRSSTQVRVSCECKDCASSLYVRELSDSAGIRIEPALVVGLSSGSPEEVEEPFFDLPESASPFDFRKPEVLAFLVIFALLLSSLLFFFGRKFYKKVLYKKFKSRKKR